MAKVFTITEGLENLGALKTGGQGSVYKGKRMGEIISAIKILPTPIYSESETDKNYISFRNEVQKLKKVNETPNPNVVSILNSGITDSGNFPFIEMEYIEGPDLGELLKPPHDPIFTIKEVIRVSEQLANALAHCHKVDVKHGDIKSNNVKFNVKSGNYILLDFGLSVMSDEQRRTSLRHAGAIEFMAPEQSNAQMFFQTDVYSFGVIIYELLAGTVPFPLNDNGEITRNKVMISHMETAPPDLMALREQNLPESWTTEKKQHEMQVPGWMIDMVYKCLEKKPEHRFINGMDLHEFVIRNSIIYASKTENSLEKVEQLQQENRKLIREKEELQHLLAKYSVGSKVAHEEHKEIDKSTDNYHSPFLQASKNSSSKNWLIILLILAVTGILAYIFFTKSDSTPTTAIKIDTLKNNTNPITNSTVPIIKQPANLVSKDINNQLLLARESLLANDPDKAVTIYESLAKKDVPEALFELGNLSLQNATDRITCDEAINYLERARNKNVTEAKTVLGLIYAFADDPEALQKHGYKRCLYTADRTKGSNLLMEAMLQGDAKAGVLLEELNMKNQASAAKDTVKTEY